MKFNLAQLGQTQELQNKLTQTLGEFNLLGGVVFSPTYLHAGIVVLCLFLFIFTFGLIQRHQTQLTMKGIMPGIALGFTLALLIEAVLLVGGKTAITELLGWKNAPKPISNAIEISRSRFVEVLGVNSSIPEGKAQEKFSAEELIQRYEELPDSEKENLKKLICPVR